MTLIIQKPTGAKLNLAKEFTWNETVWNPGMISTSLWLDAADASTVTTVSGAVSQWNDKSGNGLNTTQGTANNRPSYQTSSLASKNTIQFDGDDGLFRANVGISRNAPSSLIYAVAKGATSGTQGICLLTVGGDASPGVPNNNARQYLSFTANNLSAGGRRLDADSFQNINSSTTHDNAWVIAGSRHVWSSSDLFLYQNGTERASSLAFQTDGNASNTNSNNLIIGSNFALNQNLTGNIAEVIVITPDPTTFVRQRIEGYLAHKWGLTANLPSDHPYKTVGPTP